MVDVVVVDVVVVFVVISIIFSAVGVNGMIVKFGASKTPALGPIPSGWYVQPLASVGFVTLEYETKVIFPLLTVHAWMSKFHLNSILLTSSSNTGRPFDSPM